MSSEDPDIFLLFLKYTLKSIILTVLWLPALLYRIILAKYVKLHKPNYGRLLTPFELGMYENYTEEPAKTTMVFSLVLEGRLELEVLRHLFQRSVLGAKLHDKKTGEDIIRYPEFKQFKVDFGGHRFWKDDPTFTLDNHITEELFNGEVHESLSKFHRNLQNKLYPKERSPWEIILVRDYKDDDDASKTLLVFRSHHALADFKSVLKVIVERLGQKELKSANANYFNTKLAEKIKYYALLPFYFVYVQVFTYILALKHAGPHPWKVTGGNHELINVGISKKIKINDIKAKAKKHKVTTSAIIMSAITGGIGKSDGRLRERDVLCQWILPKPNHPDTLANHSLCGVIDIPTTITSPEERTKLCEGIFNSMRVSNLWKYVKVVLIQNMTWFNPVRDYLTKGTPFYHVCITNIAGDAEGIEIGNCPCSEMTFSCGPLGGARGNGLLISAYSYKGAMEITIGSRNSNLDEESVQKLADLIYEEFEAL